MNKIAVALAFSLIATSAAALPTRMEESDRHQSVFPKSTGTVMLKTSDRSRTLDCSETIMADSGGDDLTLMYVKHRGFATLVDFGDSFTVINVEAEAMVYSGFLKDRGDANQDMSDRLSGVTFHRGKGVEEGIFLYYGRTEIIKWDCRK